jgi:hypothetical protein
MRRTWWLRGLKFALFGVLAIGLAGAVVMLLWNALLPALFGLPAIGFWQALGLLVLSRILVGGLRGRGDHGHWRGRMMARWEQMSEEERERFRAGMGRRCGMRSGELPRTPG